MTEPEVIEAVAAAKRRCDGLVEQALLLSKVGYGSFLDLITTSAYLQGVDDAAYLMSTRCESKYEENR